MGRRLRVKTLLEGSVRKAGERLRIGVQLTSVESGFQLWSAQYDRDLRDIFAIQTDVAQGVVRELAVTLSPKESIALRTSPTGDVRAYDCYLRGRSFYYRYSPRDVQFALEMFLRAAEIDSGYARAYAGIADCWSYLYLYSDRSDRIREQAQWASSKAVEMDANSAQAQASHGLSLSLSGRDEEAEKAFETATRLDPGLFEAHYFHARHCFARGRLDQAVQFYEKAIEARPDDFQSPLLVAQSYDVLGRGEEARAARRRGIEAAERHLKLNPDDARAVYMAANGFVGLDDAVQGRCWADRALDMSPDDPMLLYNVGCIYSMLGVADRAIECLERAVKRGLTQKGWYQHDSNLDPLRDHPRFVELLRSLN
jgi:tetratricopeptide (TPR) repeat protein